MSNRRSIKIGGNSSRFQAHNLVDAAPLGYVVTVGEETRSQEQNRLMWPLIKAIREQVPGMSAFSDEQIKLRFLNALGVEMQFLPELEGPGMFPVGMRSSTLSKTQFSALIDLLNEYAARHGVNLERIAA